MASFAKKVTDPSYVSRYPELKNSMYEICFKLLNLSKLLNSEIPNIKKQNQFTTKLKERVIEDYTDFYKNIVVS